MTCQNARKSIDMHDAPLIDRGYNAAPAPNPGWLVAFLVGLVIVFTGAACVAWALGI